MAAEKPPAVASTKPSRRTSQVEGGRRTGPRAAVLSAPSAPKPVGGPVSGGGGPLNERIEPRPSRFTEFTRDRAEKLATLRRGWFDELTWATATGFAASLPAAIHSFLEARAAHDEFLLNTAQATDIGICGGFLVATVIAFFGVRNRGPSSIRYLEQHFGRDPDYVPAWPKRLCLWVARKLKRGGGATPPQ